MKTCWWKQVLDQRAWVPDCLTGVDRILKSIPATQSVGDWLYCPYCGGKIAPYSTQPKEKDHE